MSDSPILPTPIEQALPLAQEFAAALRPHAVRLAIAGSIRRQRTVVKDIEIVAQVQPATATDMFGQPIPDAPSPTLLALPAVLAQTGWTLVKGGDRYKQLSHPDHPLKLDLFLVHDPAHWGLVYLLRTGSAEFNLALVNHINQLGWHLADNTLHQHRKQNDQPCTRGSQCSMAAVTPEEADVFAALSLPWIPPASRNPESLRKAIRARFLTNPARN